MDGKTEGNVLNSDPATEPIDLAQAFKMYNEANRTPAQEPVDAGEAAEGVEQGSNGGEPEPSGTASEGDESLDTTAEVGSDEGDDASSGGSANVVEPIDFNARKQELLKQIQRDAIDSVRQDFTANQITPCSIEELYNRDEQTGRVTFKNPDDPTRDFASRAEAQQWVDAFNKQIEMRFRQEVNKKQQELLSSRSPMLRLIDFAPKFNALDKTTQDILDDLIEPYAIRDNEGNVIGFNVNLDSALTQAQKIAKRFNTKPAEPENKGEAGDQPKAAGSRPAMNMPTGAGKSADEAEPKNIQEAMRMYNKAQKEKAQKKGRK